MPRSEGLWGELVFVAVAAALTALGVPRQSVAFLGGYAFGVVLGTALSLLAQLLGCAASYGFARALGRDWAARRMQGRFGPKLRPRHVARRASERLLLKSAAAPPMRKMQLATQ